MRKIQYLVLGLSVSCLLFSGCGTKSTYRNPVTGEVMEESVSESSAEEIETLISEVVEELSSEIEEETETEISLEEIEENIEPEIESTEETEPAQEEEFSIDKALGNYIGEEELFGVKYRIYENGAEVSQVEESFAEIEEEIEHDGKVYPVISLACIHYEWEEFVVPEHIKYINRRAFQANYSNVKSQLKSVIIPDTVEYMSGYETFFKCRNLEQVMIPENIKTDIEWNKTFESCNNLKSIVIPNGVEVLEGDYTYEDGVFLGCNSLESVVIPDTVTEIGYGAFRGCCSLTEIDIPESVTQIGYKAFAGTSISKINIPELVTSFPIEAVADCVNLEELIIPDTVTSCSGKFGDCPNLKKVKFSNNMETPNTGEMFSKCTSLEEIIFPDSTMDIEKRLFAEKMHEDNRYTMLDMSNFTLYVPEKAVSYLQKKFPEATVKAKETF